MDFITPNWPAPKNIRALTTTKTCWGNLGVATSDLSERARLVKNFNLPADPIWLKQIHSAIAVPATETKRNTEADSSFTTEPNQICLVLTADCLPLLICNQTGTAVAAIHAGWRGLAAGIIENTIHEMNEKPEDLLVWLGPAIGPTKFEVGKDVYEAFVNADLANASSFLPSSQDKWLANLYQLAAHRLNKLNITQIYGGEFCTYNQDDMFFSWRREKSTIGRMASLIWIT